MQNKNAVFSKLYADKYDLVYGKIYNEVKDKCVAEDLASNIFIKVYEKMDELDEKALGSYLFISTRNKLIDYGKWAKLRHPVPEFYDYYYEDMSHGASNDILEVLDRHADEIGQLNLKIFKMKALDGLKHREIAENLKMTKCTVTAKYYEAKKYIKENILAELLEY